MSKQRDKFTAARVAMITRYVFFGCIAMQLELVEDSNLSHAAATDGKRLIFNPELTESLAFGQVFGLVAHEVMHIVFMHHLRRKGRGLKKWNVACDHADNLELRSQFGRASKATDPTIEFLRYHDEQYRGLSAEEIYDRLPDQDGDSDFDMDAVMDGAAGTSESEVAAMEASVKGMIQNAAAMARKAGQMSGNLAKLVEAICEPKANWRAIIQDYLTQKAEIDYSWAKPNQRMLSQYGIIYPMLDGEKLGKLGVLFDTSGSCYADLEQFVSELSDILESYVCDITVFYVDTDIVGVDQISQDDLPIKLTIYGGGGTAVSKAYQTIEENYDFDLIIHCTDGEIPDWGLVSQPTSDVLVVLTHKTAVHPPSWAELIFLD